MFSGLSGRMQPCAFQYFRGLPHPCSSNAHTKRCVRALCSTACSNLGAGVHGRVNMRWGVQMLDCSKCSARLTFRTSRIEAPAEARKSPTKFQSKICVSLTMRIGVVAWRGGRGNKRK